MSWQHSSLTLISGAIRLNVGSGHLAVNHLQGVSFAANASKDSGSIKAKVKSLCKRSRGVTQETNLNDTGLMVNILVVIQPWR